jgi:hypothetical protein
MNAGLWKSDHRARWAGEVSVARIRAGIARARDDDGRWCDILGRVPKLERMGFRLRIAGPEIELPAANGGTEDEDQRWSDILRRVVC